VALDPALPILVVDDYQTMVKILRGMLSDLGFQDVDSAHDGEEALRKMRDKRYGLVISDWNMEPMSGIDLLRRVRAEMQRDVRFIMVTAESKTDHVIAARRAGVDNYVVKPFNAQTLRKKLETTLAA
jgi:two-component system chemotaxis response regulator CheY